MRSNDLQRPSAQNTRSCGPALALYDDIGRHRRLRNARGLGSFGAASATVIAAFAQTQRHGCADAAFANANFKPICGFGELRLPESHAYSVALLANVTPVAVPRAGNLSGGADQITADGFFMLPADQAQIGRPPAAITSCTISLPCAVRSVAAGGWQV